MRLIFIHCLSAIYVNRRRWLFCFWASYVKGGFVTVNSPLESLAAFAIAFMAGVVTCIVLRLHIQVIQAEAVAVYRS